MPGTNTQQSGKQQASTKQLASEKLQAMDNNTTDALIRIAGLATGSVIAVAAMRRGGLTGGLLGLLGAGLLYGSATGRVPTVRQLSMLTSPPREVHLESAVNIDRSPEEIYSYWRNFEQLPDVMSFIKRVEQKGGGRTHWVAQGPRGPALEWDSEVVEDVPNKRLSWRSLEGSDIRNHGTVEFRKKADGRGTDVVVNMDFEPPGGTVGAAVGNFLNGLENAMLSQNLHNLKARMETGEVPTNKRYSERRPS